MSTPPTSDKTGRPDAEHSALGAAGAHVAFGWQLALSMVLYTGLGYAADLWLDTTPWLLIAGAAVGILAMGVQTYRLILEANQKSERHHARYRELGAQPPPPEDAWDKDPWKKEDDWKKDDWDKA